MSAPKLLTKEIEDLYLRENFQKLNTFFASDHQLVGFKFFEISFTQNGTQKYAHNLGFIPKDIVQTSVRGGVATWNFDSFTLSEVNLTIAGASAQAPVIIRAFIGTYSEAG